MDNDLAPDSTRPCRRRVIGLPPYLRLTEEDLLLQVLAQIA